MSIRLATGVGLACYLMATLLMRDRFIGESGLDLDSITSQDTITHVEVSKLRSVTIKCWLLGTACFVLALGLSGNIQYILKFDAVYIFMFFADYMYVSSVIVPDIAPYCMLLVAILFIIAAASWNTQIAAMESGVSTAELMGNTYSVRSIESPVVTDLIGLTKFR